MVEVRNLAFSYCSRQVLRDVSFVVSPGETVAVLGANGAGKTTLLRVLAMLAVPDAGSVIMDGQNAFRRPMRYLRQLGYLPEMPALYEDMSVKEYLGYRAKLKGEPSKRVRRRVSEAAELCRLTDIMRRPISMLSTGLKKRVALADALLLRPRVLLLDDPLAGLDYQMRESAAEILSNAAAFSSVIVTGHEISDFAKWATRFLVIKDGVIASSVENQGTDPSVSGERLATVLEGGAR